MKLWYAVYKLVFRYFVWSCGWLALPLTACMSTAEACTLSLLLSARAHCSVDSQVSLYNGLKSYGTVLSALRCFVLFLLGTSFGYLT